MCDDFEYVGPYEISFGNLTISGSLMAIKTAYHTFNDLIIRINIVCGIIVSPNPNGFSAFMLPYSVTLIGKDNSQDIRIADETEVIYNA
jgi:hypothetical protein